MKHPLSYQLSVGLPSQRTDVVALCTSGVVVAHTIPSLLGVTPVIVVVRVVAHDYAQATWQPRIVWCSDEAYWVAPFALLLYVTYWLARQSRSVTGSRLAAGEQSFGR